MWSPLATPSPRDPGAVRRPPTSNSQLLLLNLSGLGAVLEQTTSSSSLVSIMGERVINNNSHSSLNITTTVNSNTTGEVEATHSSPHLSTTSLGHILRLRGRNTRLFSLNNNNNSPWRWSSSLHNTRNLSLSNSSIISRCTYSPNSNNTPIT